MPSLIATLGANISGFTSDLERAKGVARGAGADITAGWDATLGSKLRGMFGGAAIMAAGADLVRDTIQYASRVQDLADQFQITTDEVQKLDHAASKIGLTFENFGVVLSKMGSARRNAVEKDQEMRDNFARFGITLQQLNDPAVRNIDLLQQMGKAMETMNMTQADRTFMRDIGGKSGDKLIEALKLLGTERPPLISPADLKAIDEAGERLHRLKLQLMALAAEPIGGAAKILDEKAGAGEKAVGALKTSFLGIGFGLFKRLLPEEALKALGLDEKPVAGKEAEASDAKETLFKDKLREKSIAEANENMEKSMLDLAKKKAEEENKVLAIHEKIAETKRKAAMEAMSDADKEAALVSHIAELKERLARDRGYGGATDLELAEQEQSIAEREGDLVRLRMRGKDPRFKRIDTGLTGEEKSGRLLGGISALPEVRIEEVHKKNEGHLAAIRKDIARLAGTNRISNLAPRY